MFNLPLDSKNTQETDYFHAGPEREMDVATSAKITKELHDTYSDYFRIGCFKGTFSLQFKGGEKPYQAPPRHVVYAFQE